MIPVPWRVKVVDDRGGDHDEFIERIAAAVAGKLGGVQHRNSLTWRDLWTIYEQEADSANLESWNTVTGRAKHIVRIIGAVQVMDTTIVHVRTYRAQRKAEFTCRKTLTSAKTRNNEIELIRHMSRWASRQRPPLIPSDPLAGYEREELFEPLNNVRRNVVEDDPHAQLSLADLMDHGDEFDRALVLVAHSSGMRRAEIVLLERSWIDRRPGPDRKPMRIVEIPPGIAKGRKGKKDGRQTWISEEALHAIDTYTSTLPFTLQRRGVWVFMNPRTGRHYHKDHLTERFRRLQERAGMSGPSGPPWLHDLRRSFITLARRRGEETTNIMAASGHSTMEAFQRYNIHARRDALVVRDRVDAARDRELTALAEMRKGPQRASAQNVESEAPTTDIEKNNRG